MVYNETLVIKCFSNLNNLHFCFINSFLFPIFTIGKPDKRYNSNNKILNKDTVLKQDKDQSSGVKQIPTSF